MCICKPRLVCFFFMAAYLTYHQKPSRKQHSAAVYWCIFSCCFKCTTKVGFMSSSLYVCWPQIIDHFCSHRRLLLFSVMWDGGCSYFLHTIHKSLVLSQKLLEAVVVVRVAVIISEWSLEKTIPEWWIWRQSADATVQYNGVEQKPGSDFINLNQSSVLQAKL